jgi:carboxyl-terminal processing protease
MMKNRVFALMLLIVFLSGACIAANSETREKILSQMIGNGLLNWHYSGRKIDDDFSLKSFAQYTKYLDFSRSFLIQSDLDSMRPFDLKIDDEVLDGDFSLPRLGKQLLRQRVQQVRDFCQDILKRPFDFSLDEQIELDPGKRKYAGSLDDLKEWWTKRLKYMALTQYLNLSKLAEDKDGQAKKNGRVFSPELETQARKAVEKSVQRLFNRLLEDNSDDMQSLYFNALLSVFDPHSMYFPPRAKEDFDIDMSGTLEGIGALLGEDDGFIKVFEIIPGSPAWSQNLLKVEDIILKVGQGDEEPVDIVGMSVSDAARLVRGKKGSLVRLTVKKTDGRIMMISLVRNVVEIRETYARSAVLSNDNLKKTFGYIYLPKFYHDFNRRNGRNATDDVKGELEKLTARKVDGVILDLRGNGGGALDDAEKMSGLFIPKGPIVQLKDKNSPPLVQEDRDDAISYRGPLVVLVNTLSASASEILAAALQDYRRAIIIGGEHTFGKGTVQVMIDLDRYLPPEMARYKPLGAVTVTVQKYYRITGASTQYQGVVPDVILPDPYSYLDVGEKSMPYSLPWDTIPAVSFTPWKNSFADLDEIKARSRQRLNKSVRFAQVAANIERLKKQREKTMVTLNLKQFQGEQDLLFQEAERFSKEQLEFPYIQARSLQAIDAGGGDAGRAAQEAKTREWLSDLRRDPVVEEGIAVLNDWAASTRGR